MGNFYKKLSLITSLTLASLGLNAQTVYSYSGAEEVYVVPAGVSSISIEAKGAKGQNATSSSGVGGNGATMYGEFSVSPGDMLTLYAGGNPAGFQTGGEGSYVENTTSGTLLIVAGGGGGGANTKNGVGAPVTEDGTDVSESSSYADGSPGTGGNGGTAGAGSWGTGGGGGWLSAGTDGTETPGGPQPCGASAGSTFAGGAGGGYSGGAGVAMASGWGTRGGGAGGSYNIGTAQSNTAANNAGLGEITITELCSGLTFTVSDDTVCVGDEVILDASSTLGGTVSWDGGITNGVAFTPSAGSTTYTATSTDPGDCGLEITIFVGEFPTVDAGTDVMFCSGEEVTLNGSGTATDWSWDGGVTDGVAFTPASGTTTYTLTGTIDSTGCQAMDMVDVSEVVIDNTISTTGTDLMANQAGADYQWLECPAFTPVAGETSQTYASIPEGDFAVEITLDGCVDTSACQIVHVGVTELEQGIELYPNPTEGNFVLKIEGSYSYEVTNVLGSVIMNGIGNGKKEFDLSDYENGAYFVKVFTTEELKTMKVIKR